MDLSHGYSIPRSREPPAPWLIPTDRLHPAIAEQVATVGSLMREERLSEAIELLERIAVEVPGSQLVLSAAHQVHFGDLLASTHAPLRFPIGADADGEPLACDLVRAGHLLIVGSNDAEKSSFLHSMLCSLLMKTTPDELLLMMVDTKMVELTPFEGIPNLLCPIVTDPFDAITHFKALVTLMEQRYALAQEYGAKSLQELNDKADSKLPYILVIVDELADVLAVDRKAFQAAISSLTQRARTVGMHLALATQFPRGDVCSNALKHCLPDRIAFSTTSPAESRVVIGTTSAHELFGNGDCLYVHAKHAPVWVQSPHVSSADVTVIVDHWKDQTYWNQQEHYVWTLPRPAAVTSQRICGIPEALCWLYDRSGHPDDVLAVTARYPAARLDSWRAAALAQKGLTDAALLVYDDLIRRARSATLIAEAQYAKAKVLVDIGNRAAARQELAQVYAVIPDFVDEAHLLAKLNAKRRDTTRSPIPEAVRHAVWRRDEAACVRCGAQENLEFDHIIPVSRGGANTERNLQLLCERCNREKSATI